MNMDFEKVNLNPMGKKFGDCSVRALAKATGKDWLTIYDELCQLGRSIYCLPNDTETIKIYLDKFPHDSCNAVKGKKRQVVNDFNKGTYILMIANHWTCVKDGVCFDLWDCRKKCVYRYWKIAGSE